MEQGGSRSEPPRRTQAVTFIDMHPYFVCLTTRRRAAKIDELPCSVVSFRLTHVRRTAMASPRLRFTLPSRPLSQVWGCVLSALTMVAVLSALYYGGRAVVQTGWSYWIFVPLSILVGAVWWLTVFLLPLYLVTSARKRVLKNEHFTLSLARRSAGVAGTESQNGPITIWSSGPSDPAPMVQQQLELVRGGLSALLGRQIQPRAPLRVYWFDTRDSLERYHRGLSLATGNSGGGYVPAPARLITISLEGILSRLTRAREMGTLPVRLLLARARRGISPPILVARGGRTRPRRKRRRPGNRSPQPQNAGIAPEWAGLRRR